MSKTNLQSTTHGGGRVLSVILAGTLAMGMTPAVALTTESLQPMQAFAVEDTWTTATVTLSSNSAELNSTTTEVDLPSVTVTVGGKGLTAGTDYTASWLASDGGEIVNNKATKAGTYTVTVTSKATTEAGGTADLTATKAFVVTAATVTPTPDPNPGDTKTNIGTLALVVTDSEGQTIVPGTPAKIKVPASAKPAEAATKAINDFAEGLVVTDAAGKTITCDAVAQNNVITLTGTDTYEGSVSNYSYVVEYTFGDANVQSDYSAPYTYNAKSQTPKLTVYNPETGAVATSGYTVKYQQTVNGVTNTVDAPTNVGAYTAVVTWDGYPATETATVDFNINPAALASSYVTISDPANLTWTGNTLAVPEVTVTANWGNKQNPNNVTLVKDVDYTVTLKNAADDSEVLPANFKATGSYYLQIAGKDGSNYSTSATLKSKPFKVQGAALSSATIAVKDPSKLLIEKAGTPVTITAEDLVVTLDGKTLTSPADFSFSTVTVSAPTANVPIKITPGTNNDYSGFAQTTVNVLGSVALCDVTPIPAQEYGAAGSKTPAIELTYTDNGNKTVLTQGVDYKVTYGANTGAGTKAGSYTITGIGNGWGGTVTDYYTINGTTAEIRNIVTKKVTYNGTVQNPADFITFDVYADEDDNAATPMTKVNPSDYTYTITTNREFKDAGAYTFTINLADCSYNVDSTNSDTIKIAQADLAELTVVSDQESYLITDGKKGPLPIEPKFTVTLNGTEYELTSNDVKFEYENASGTSVAGADLNKATGEITATLTGLASGNFQNESVVTFDIYNNIANLFPVEIPAVTYNGKAQTPAVTLLTEELAADAAVEPSKVIPEINGTGNNTTANYTVAYADNINAGTGKIIVTGTPNATYAYAGTLEIPFTINKAAGTIAVADIADQVYTGSAIAPEPTATITANGATVSSTYAYSYTNNINAGEATVTVVPTGVGANYDVAAATKTFKINAAAISGATYTGDTTVKVGKQPAVSFTFNGKTLVKDVDYKVVATPIVDKEGKATLTVEGIGNFKGTKTVTITVSNSATPGKPDQPTTTTPGWKSNATGWWYVDANGSYPTNTWKAIGGAWYHFDAAGYMSTGWVNDMGTWYYCYKASDGMVEGKMAQGWKFIDGKWYYFAANGAMQTGWQKINGAWYLLNTQHDGTYGAMLTGWQRVDHASGMPTTANSWYYFYPSTGALATNTWIGNYHVDSTGYWNY